MMKILIWTFKIHKYKTSLNGFGKSTIKSWSLANLSLTLILFLMIFTSCLQYDIHVCQTLPSCLLFAPIGRRRIKFDPLCLHWSCSPLTVQASDVTSRGGATPMQAKWIKLDHGRHKHFTSTNQWRLFKNSSAYKNWPLLSEVIRFHMFSADTVDVE